MSQTNEPGNPQNPSNPTPPPPPGQGPIDPRAAFGPPTGAGGRPPNPPPPGLPPGRRPPQGPPPGYVPQPYPPPQPAPQRGGGGSSLLTAVAAGIFIVSLLANVVLVLIVVILAATAASSAAGGAALLQRTVVRDGGGATVAVVPVEGIIDGLAAEIFADALERAAGESNLAALVLSIDSPGGGVTPSDEMYQAVLQFKADHPTTPVIAQLNGLAASGGYYVACAADDVVAQRTTLTGSIGVLLSRYDLTGLGEKIGVADGSIVSTGAPFKTVGDPFTELTDEQADYLRGVIDDSFETFKAVVQKARGPALAKAGTTVDAVANGKIFSSRQALALGLIDQEGYPGDAYALAEARAGVTGATIVRYDRPPTVFEALGVKSPGGGGAAAPAGVGVSVDADLIHGLTTPRLMYLWRGR